MKETGNILPFLYASRLLQFLDLNIITKGDSNQLTHFLRLKQSLAAENKNTNENVLQELQKVRMSSEERKIKSTDQIQKLLSLLEKSTKSGVRTMMQSCQVVGGERSWISKSKWSIVSRVNSSLTPGAEYKFVMTFVCEAGLIAMGLMIF